MVPHMNSLISKSQSAFIKKRSIHDNFMSVQCAIRRFHRSKTPSLFLKLDITKAFDSVRWEYLLTMMSRLGFPPKWREWIASLLSTSSSHILLNGVPTAPINHRRGLRQGDPLLSLLFVNAIDPLQKILDLAIEEGHLAKFRGKQTVMRHPYMRTTQLSSLGHIRRTSLPLLIFLPNLVKCQGSKQMS